METPPMREGSGQREGGLIYLIRHGQTDLNLNRIMQGRIDAPLNETGRAQADEIGRRLAEVALGAIYSSPLSRALHTAQAIARHHPGLEVVVVPELAELSMGSYEGIAEEELYRRFGEEFARFRRYCYLIPPPGGDSLADAERRLAEWLERWRDEAAHHPIAIVGHQGVNLAIKAHYLGLGLDSPTEELAEKMTRLRQPNDRIDLVDPWQGRVVGAISLSAPG